MSPTWRTAAARGFTRNSQVSRAYRFWSVRIFEMNRACLSVLMHGSFDGVGPPHPEGVHVRGVRDLGRHHLDIPDHRVPGPQHGHRVERIDERTTANQDRVFSLEDEHVVVDRERRRDRRVRHPVRRLRDVAQRNDLEGVTFPRTRPRSSPSGSAPRPRPPGRSCRCRSRSRARRRRRRLVGRRGQAVRPDVHDDRTGREAQPVHGVLPIRSFRTSAGLASLIVQRSPR